MGYIFDSCVYIHKINSFTKIVQAYEESKKKGKSNYTSNIVLNELNPNKSNLGVIVSNCVTSNYVNLININSSNEMQKNFNEIRLKHYSWMSRPSYLNMLVQKGYITEDEIKTYNFKYKDYGECSLIAIALTDIEKYTLITEDRGQVYLHPNINIFEKYPNVKVINYNGWENEVKD